MDNPDGIEFARHGIVGIEHPDGTRSAQEMIVHQTAKGDFVITPVPGTERSLPLTREQAMEWVYNLPGHMPSDVQKSQIEMLCGKD